MAKDFSFRISSEKQLPEAAAKLLDFAGEHRLFLFDAPMGAGKTTFIKELCRALGCPGPFSSPTYALVNVYDCDKQKVYHCDFYRVKSVEELFDLGIEEFADGTSYCFIEWPDLFLQSGVDKYISVKIEVAGPDRVLHCEKVN